MIVDWRSTSRVAEKLVTLRLSKGNNYPWINLLPRFEHVCLIWTVESLSYNIKFRPPDWLREDLYGSNEPLARDLWQRTFTCRNQGSVNGFTLLTIQLILGRPGPHVQQLVWSMANLGITSPVGMGGTWLNPWTSLSADHLDPGTRVN